MPSNSTEIGPLEMTLQCQWRGSKAHVNPIHGPRALPNLRPRSGRYHGQIPTQPAESSRRVPYTRKLIIHDYAKLRARKAIEQSQGRGKDVCDPGSKKRSGLVMKESRCISRARNTSERRCRDSGAGLGNIYIVLDQGSGGSGRMVVDETEEGLGCFAGIGMPLEKHLLTAN
jgi:hypothetical protein